MTDKLVVYTSLYGKYERLLDQPPAAADSGVPFVCFTDQPDLQSATWEIRHVPGPFPGDPVRNSRRAKILAHRYLPEFDTSLFIDNSVELLRPPREIVDLLLPQEAGMAQLEHSFRAKLADEFAAVIDANRDTHWRVCEQYGHYLAEDSEVLDSPVTVTGILVRRHADPLLQATMESWWEQVLRYSRRDQLSIDLAVKRSGLVRAVHQLDIRATEFHRWPREGLQRDLGAATVDARDAHRDCTRWGGLDVVEPVTSIELDALRTELRTLRLRLQRVQRSRDAWRTEVHRLRNSTSWRITRPLRAIGRVNSSFRKGRAEVPAVGQVPTLATQAARWLEGRVPGQPMVPSVYGVDLMPNWADSTFRFSVAGDRGWTLANLLTEESTPFAFVDVGASHGLFSLLAAKNPSCRRVFSIEPVPSVRQLLEQNVAASPFGRKIAVHPYALSGRAAEREIAVDPEHTGLSSLEHQRRDLPTETISVRTADALGRAVRATGLRTCIKIDVEGHEASVLRELRRVGLLDEADWVFYEANQTWSDPEELERICRSAGFDSFSPTADGPHYDVLARRRVLDVGAVSNAESWAGE